MKKFLGRSLFVTLAATTLAEGALISPRAAAPAPLRLAVPAAAASPALAGLAATTLAPALSPALVSPLAPAPAARLAPAAESAPQAPTTSLSEPAGTPRSAEEEAAELARAFDGGSLQARYDAVSASLPRVAERLTAYPGVDSIELLDGPKLAVKVRARPGQDAEELLVPAMKEIPAPMRSLIETDAAEIDGKPEISGEPTAKDLGDVAFHRFYVAGARQFAYNPASRDGTFELSERDLLTRLAEAPSAWRRLKDWLGGASRRREPGDTNLLRFLREARDAGASARVVRGQVKKIAWGYDEGDYHFGMGGGSYSYVAGEDEYYAVMWRAGERSGLAVFDARGEHARSFALGPDGKVESASARPLPPKGDPDPAPGARLSAMTFVVFDFETLGFWPEVHPFVELGAAKFRLAGDGKVELLGTYRSYADPGQPVPAHITKLTGITDADVAGAPTRKEVVTGFAAFAAEADVLMAHSAFFDAQYASESGFRSPKPVVDTKAIARKFFGKGNDGLPQLRRELGIEVEGQGHRGDVDAAVTAPVFAKLLGKAAKEFGKPVSELTWSDLGGYTPVYHAPKVYEDTFAAKGEDYPTRPIDVSTEEKKIAFWNEIHRVQKELFRTGKPNSLRAIARELGVDYEEMLKASRGISTQAITEERIANKQV